MTVQKVKLPPGKRAVTFHEATFRPQPNEDHIMVPTFVVPHLVEEHGCEFDGDHTQIDVADALRSAPHEHLSIFLNAHGHNDHFWEKKVHIFSSLLREKVGHIDTQAVGQHGLTVEKGSLEFSADGVNIIGNAVITSKLVPEMTRVDRIVLSSPDAVTDTRKRQLYMEIEFAQQHGEMDTFAKLNAEMKALPTGLRGLMKLPAGKTVDDIVSGTDPDATFACHVDGHMIADILDDFHGRFHKDGPGRIVFLTPEEKLAKALELHEKSTAQK